MTNASQIIVTGVSFLDLPAEVRNTIYNLVVVQQEPIKVHCAARTPLDHQLTPGLLRVNHQVHGEATPVFYGTNLFTRNGSYVSFDERSLCAWLTRIGSARRHLRKVEITHVRNLIRFKEAEDASGRAFRQHEGGVDEVGRKPRIVRRQERFKREMRKLVVDLVLVVAARVARSIAPQRLSSKDSFVFRCSEFRALVAASMLHRCLSCIATFKVMGWYVICNRQLASLFRFHRIVYTTSISNPNFTCRQRDRFVDTIRTMATSTYSSYTTTSLRRLTHTETLPYHPSTVFSAASDVSKYSTFLPLVLSSTVTTKDAHHLPKHAKLKIGHPTLGIEEEWLCMVSCDRSTGTIIAKNKEVEGANGVFESWLMRWKIQPPPTATGAGARKTATATLELEVKFRGIMYDQMFALLQDGVAKRMMEKFMVRIAELDEIERKERLEKIKEKARAEAARKAAVAKSGQQPTKAAGKGADPPKPAAKTTEPAAKAAPKKLEVRSGVK